MLVAEAVTGVIQNQRQAASERAVVAERGKSLR
jgi:hypothetical protein